MSESIQISKRFTPYNFTDCNDASRIKYIVIHYVGALGGAEANCNYYASTYVGASAHYYVGFTGEIWQSVAAEDIAWSVGASSYTHPAARNSNTLSIEMCVRKKSVSSMGATDKDWYFENATVLSTISLTKMLMKKYSIPLSNVIRHYDITGKICPNPYVYNHTMYTWNDFKSSLGQEDGPTVTTEYFRIGTGWKNDKCVEQIGAYTKKEGAIDACPAGYKVFDSDGNIVYSGLKANGTLPSAFKGLDEKTAASKILEIAKKDYKKTGILASVTSAQMILESGYVTTDLAVNACNCFGMKEELSGNTWADTSWDGKSTYTKITEEEYTPGVITKISAKFRKYSSIEKSVADHSAYLLGAKNGSKLRYAGLKGEKNYRKAITIIKEGGYATDSKYIDKICNIIERFNLNKYDKDTIVTPPTPSLKYNVGTYVNCSSCYKNSTDSISAAIIKNISGKITNVDSTKINPYQVEGKYWVNDGDIRSTEEPKPIFSSYSVNISSPDLRIRTNPTTSAINSGYTGKGVFTIVEEKTDSNGKVWGLLKSYGKKKNGWIALYVDCVKKIKNK